MTTIPMSKRPMLLILETWTKITIKVTIMITMPLIVIVIVMTTRRRKRKKKADGEVEIEIMIVDRGNKSGERNGKGIVDNDASSVILV